MLILLRSASVAGTEFKAAVDTAYLSVVEDDLSDVYISVLQPYALRVTDIAVSAINLPRGDDAGINLVEVAVVSTTVPVSIAGTDSQGLSATEVARVDVAIDVTDTASLTLTDGGAVDVLDNLLDVTDTASLTLTDAGSLDRRDYAAVPFVDDDTMRLRLEEVAFVDRYSPVAGMRVTFGEWTVRVSLL